MELAPHSVALSPRNSRKYSILHPKTYSLLMLKAPILVPAWSSLDLSAFELGETPGDRELRVYDVGTRFLRNPSGPWAYADGRRSSGNPRPYLKS